MYFIKTVLVSAVLVYSVGGKEMKEGNSDTSLHTANRVSIEYLFYCISCISTIRVP